MYTDKCPYLRLWNWVYPDECGGFDGLFACLVGCKALALNAPLLGLRVFRGVRHSARLVDPGVRTGVFGAGTSSYQHSRLARQRTPTWLSRPATRVFVSCLICRHGLEAAAVAYCLHCHSAVWESDCGRRAGENRRPLVWRSAVGTTVVMLESGHSCPVSWWSERDT